MFCKGEGSALALRAVVPMSEEKLDGFFQGGDSAGAAGRGATISAAN
jgi:hypothetical protein